MKRLTSPLLALLLAVILLGLPVLSARSQSSAPNAYDVIAAVNALRSSRGLGALQADGSLMSAAQGHSDYMAANSIISHTGRGGSSPKDRAVAAGYGGGSGVVVTENIAVAQAASAVDTIINSIWGDSLHMSTMLNASYTHIGVGVSTASGQAYYALKAGHISGGQAKPPASSTTAPGSTQPQADAPAINAVQTVAPAEDGSIVHEVLPGQAPWSIAIAYGIKIAELAEMNNLNPDAPVIFAGQKLVIRPAFTPTISPTVTQTTVPPTRTLAPTATERPPTRTAAPIMTVTPTEKALLPEVDLLQSLDRRTIGIGIIVVCALGLLTIIASSLLKKS
jgi:LysM repeat protein